MSTDGRIFSIGHGGLTSEALIERLVQASVRYVIDVRSMPYSKFQPEFGREVFKGTLERRLGRGRGTRGALTYVFMGDLLGGRPADDSCYTPDGRVDYVKTRAAPFFERGLERLRDARRQGLLVSLMCSEALPTQCHRAKLIGKALGDEGIEVLHILPSGEQQTQSRVMAMLRSAQSSMFGEVDEADLQMSRKAYR